MIKKIKESIVFKNKFFTLYNDEVEFNEKTKGTHVKLEGANKQDGIAVLPVLENGNILLVKNFRYSANKFLYQVVKGGNGTQFTTDELALQCVKEELEEEMNKYSEHIIPFGRFYESPSILSTNGFGFLALNCKEVIDKKYHMEDSECIDSIVEIPIDEIDDFMRGVETCSTTLFLISKYQKHLLEEKIYNMTK